MTTAAQQPIYTSNAQITSKLATEDFVPDGNLEKPVWRKAVPVSFDHDWAGQRHFPQLRTEVRSLWTSKYLYVSFRCNYAELNVHQAEDPAKERWQLWERDVVEVFVNPEPQRMQHYYEFEVAPNNQWIDLEIDLTKQPPGTAAWDSRFDHAVRVNEKKHVWTCEMRIPLSSLRAEIQPDALWRVNFYRAEGKGSDLERALLAWSPVPGEHPNFHVPSRFGVLQFEK
jgi:alpha-galactosidase